MTNLSRRKWLRNSLLASSALLVAGNRPIIGHPYNHKIINDNGFIRLNWNENPFGPSPKAIQAVAEVMTTANRYPDSMVNELKDLLAGDYGLTESHFFITAGSTEVLSLLGQHVGLVKGEIVTPYPSFPTMLQFGQACGASVKKVKLDGIHKIDLNSTLSAINDNTKLVFICNPNNPTSTEVDSSALIQFCRRVPSDVLICVDEAYIEYSNNGVNGSMASLVHELPNLIVCRTFSKAYGIAGLRIGYAISSPENIQALSRRHPGWELSAGIAPIAAALASYKDSDFLKMCINNNEIGRQIVYKALDQWGIGYSRSSTNFIYVESSGFHPEVVTRMKDDNILITKWPDMDNYIRVSIGKSEEMEIFVDRIKKYVLS